MGISYLEVPGAGPSPDPRSIRFRYWALSLRDWRLRECPIARGTTYYFSTTGADGNDGLTSGAPKQTKAAAQALITASSGNIAVLFKRGDEWTDSQVLTLDHANITIGAYGSGFKPRFSRFSLKYNAAGWTLAAGNRYTRAEATTVGNVRYQGYDLSKSATSPYVLSRQTSQANCESTSNSWFWSGGTLHINTAGIDPNTLNLEACETNTVSGILVDNDGCRIDNIRTDGWGADAANPISPQAYGIKTRVNGTDAAVVSNCECYYSSAHVLAHYTTTGSGSGGIALFDNCQAGFAMRSSGSGESIFNTYAPQGGQETIFWNCTATAGTLPTGTTWTILGDYSFGHGGAPVTFILTWNDPDVPSIIPSAYGCARGGRFDIGSIPASATDITAIRCWIVGENFTGSGSTCPVPWVCSTGHVYINCSYDLTPPELTTSAITSAGATSQTFEGWLINCIFKIDLTNQSGTGARGLFNALGTTNRVKFWHCYFWIIPVDNAFRLDFDTLSADSSPNSEMKNTIYNASPPTGANVVYVGLNNSAVTQRNNAYAGITGGSGTSLRYEYGNAANKVEVQQVLTPYALRQAGDFVFAGADPDVGVNYDFYWRERNLTSPTIGPIESGPLFPAPRQRVRFI